MSKNHVMPNRDAKYLAPLLSGAPKTGFWEWIDTQNEYFGWQKSIGLLGYDGTELAGPVFNALGFRRDPTIIVMPLNEPPLAAHYGVNVASLTYVSAPANHHQQLPDDARVRDLFASLEDGAGKMTREELAVPGNAFTVGMGKKYARVLAPPTRFRVFAPRLVATT